MSQSIPMHARSSSHGMPGYQARNSARMSLALTPLVVNRVAFSSATPERIHSGPTARGSMNTVAVGALAALLILNTAGCGPKSPPGNQWQPTTFTPAEQEIVEALLSQHFDTKNSKQQVIVDTTSVSRILWGTYDDFSRSLRKEAEGRDKAFREALDDFLKKNKTAVRLLLPTNAPNRVVLVSTATVEDIFAPKGGPEVKGWSYFYRRFPGASGLIDISRVGIDSKGTVAIVYLGQQHQNLDGMGTIRVLRRDRKTWVLTHDGIGSGWRS